MADDLCWAYSKFGVCKRGAECTWVHQGPGEEGPGEDNVCRAWRLWGACPRAEQCTWAHPTGRGTPNMQWPCIPFQCVLVNAPAPGPWCDNSNAAYNAPWDAGSDGQQCFKTDGQISGEGQGRTGKPLVPWEGGSCDDSKGAVEDLISLSAASPELEETGKKGGKWDQFEVNQQKFGVKTTFLDDLSQYTTPLNVSKVPSRIRRKAERIAAEIEAESNGPGHHTEEENNDYGCDEEAKFSAVSPTTKRLPANSVWA